MILTSKLAACAALIFVTIIPVVRSVDIPVVVGGPGTLAFSPASVNANPGDVILFTFKQKNHTATQSSFDAPCVPLPGGFDSGFIPVSATNTDGPFPAAQFTVKDTSPVWVYCRQASHCQQGMVFAVNPGDKFAAFQAAATGNPSTSSSTQTTIPLTSAAVPETTAAAATTTATSPAATPTSTVSTDHHIVVGGPGTLVYTPSNITAEVGDTVTFEFRQKNHTVTQSSFAAPCNPLSMTSMNGQIGFDSGFMPVSDSDTTFPSYTIQINDTAPIWVYCRQVGHCADGMVFSVNAVESGPNNFDAFRAKAMSNNTRGPNPSSGSKPTSSVTMGLVSMMVVLVAAVLGTLL